MGAVAALGDRVLGVFDRVGRFSILASQSVRVVGRRRFPFRELLVQFEAIAVRSSTIVTITALVYGHGSGAPDRRVPRSGSAPSPTRGASSVSPSVLELGPVLTALMVSGRVGAGIAAELGSMKVTEQVDAIRAMGADPVQKLVLPRVAATTLGLPAVDGLRERLGESSAAF